jgi:hypothetical protein
MSGIELPSGDEIHKAVFELFDSVKESHPEDLLSALVPIDTSFEPGNKLINYLRDYEMQEVCYFLEDFRLILEEIDNKEQEMRIKIMIYCHIMEGDLPFIILWNLLRVLEGHKCEAELSMINKKGEKVICVYPGQKIAEIERLSTRLKLRIGQSVRKFWERDLRNAFNHSQYFLSDSLFTITKNLLQIPRELEKKRAVYTYQDIDRLYSCSVSFLSSFIDFYKFYIEPYRDGKAYRIQLGFIKWDANVQRWLWG